MSVNISKNVSQDFVPQKDVAKKADVSLRTIKRHAGDQGIKDKRVSGVIGYSKADAQKILASFNKPSATESDTQADLKDANNYKANDHDNNAELILSTLQLVSKKVDHIDANVGMPMEANIGGVAAETLLQSASVQDFCSKLVTKDYLSSILNQVQKHLADQINTVSRCETQTQLKLVECTKAIVGNQFKLSHALNSHSKLSDDDVQRIAQTVANILTKKEKKESK